jgi:hypothetical protein
MTSREKACFAIILVCAVIKGSERRQWVKEWFTKKPTYTHTKSLHEITFLEPRDFHNHFHMRTSAVEGELLSLIAPQTMKCRWKVRCVRK